MRRARIQVKPNIAKAAKQAPAPIPPPASVAEKNVVENLPEPPAVPMSEEPRILEDIVMRNQNYSPDDDAPSESMKSLHVDTAKSHHVHFTDDVIDNEQMRNNQTDEDGVAGNQNSVLMTSPTSHHNSIQFASPHAPARLTPRSRNVSMCEDEAILQPKQPREKKRFTGKEELDTKTWKMSDLARWNPRNDQTSFKRERRSSTSSTVITKSEIGDFDAPTPRINAPQVKIGADGRLVIDETSLVVQSAQINHESVWETVEEGRMGSKITSMSFRNRIFRKPNLWSERETDLFYEVLQCTGQDFGLMHHYLPSRSRPELKAKYNREEKQNWARLLKAISHPVRLDGELEVRIAKFMAEMEEETREKKAKSEYEKQEERRVREQIRIQKATERNEERLKKLQAKELVKQAKELERDARIAAKLNLKMNEKAEKEARARELSETRQTEKAAEKAAEREAKEKEKSDAKMMAIEAKRIAMEARNIIKETRKAEKEKRKEARVQSESHNLEREAERIIRRLIQESQREERRSAQKINRKGSEKRHKEKDGTNGDNTDVPSSSAAPLDETVDPNASGGELGDTTSESSESSSTASSSDEEALKKKTAKREKERMKEARRNMEPRKTVIDKKPIYINMDPKYAQQPVSRSVEMVLKANGNMFDSADEQDEVPDPDSMDTSFSSTSAPIPHVTPSKDNSASGPASESAPEPAPPPVVELEMDEPVPQAVTDVIEDIVRSRSKTPVETKIVTSTEKTEKKNCEKREIERKDDEESGEPSAKMARIEDDRDSMIIDVVGDTVEVVGESIDVIGETVEIETSQPDPVVMDVEEETIDVVTVDEEPIDVETVDVETIPAVPTSDVEVSSASSSSSSTSTASVPVLDLSRRVSLARRTVKKPVNWIKKK